ncbi:MAG: anti-sigma factor [Shimia sp.]
MTVSGSDTNDSWDDAALAGEYALGLMSSAEARGFEARLASEPDLRALYAEWCDHLVPMADGPDVAPPKRVQARLRRRLFSEVGMGEQLARWVLGAVVGAAAAGAAVFVALPYLEGPGAPVADFRADLAGEGVVYAAEVDSRTGALVVRAALGAPSPGRAHEVWAILPEAAPASLGLVGPDGVLRADLGGVDPAVLATVTLAISDEPAGGSPTGAPTGDVLAAAPLVAL